MIIPRQLIAVVLLLYLEVDVKLMEISIVLLKVVTGGPPQITLHRMHGNLPWYSVVAVLEDTITIRNMVFQSVV